MMIVDAQIHIWAKGTPSAHHRQEPAKQCADLAVTLEEGFASIEEVAPILAALDRD